MEFSHVSVLLKETVDGAFTDPKGVYADLTTGGGGHSLELAKRLDGGRLICFDQDKEALVALWAVNVQFTKVDDIARKVEDQRALLAEAQEENSLLQSRLDSKANISYIEEYAANELGMAKVTNSQINYLDVNTENLIEVTPENNGSIFSAVADWFGDLLEYIGF